MFLRCIWCHKFASEQYFKHFFLALNMDHNDTSIPSEVLQTKLSTILWLNWVSWTCKRNTGGVYCLTTISILMTFKLPFKLALMKFQPKPFTKVKFIPLNSTTKLVVSSHSNTHFWCRYLMLMPRKAKPRMIPMEAATQRVAYTVGLTRVCSILV